MPRRLLMLLAVGLAGLTLLAAGCGGDGDESAAEETTTELTTTTTETETTEATETETTEATETETTETTEAGGDVVTSEDCLEFAQVGARISEALTGTSDLGEIEAAFDELAAAAPDEIKDDFAVLSDYIATVADAVGDVGPGETPSAEALAKLQSLDAAAATAASQNIATWAQENCGGVTP